MTFANHGEDGRESFESAGVVTGEVGELRDGILVLRGM